MSIDKAKIDKLMKLIHTVNLTKAVSDSIAEEHFKSMREEFDEIKDKIIEEKDAIINEVISKIPIPKDGEDGKDADEEKIINEVLKQIPIPKDGKDGKDGKTPVAGIDFPIPQDGRTPIAGIDFQLPKDGKDGINGSPDSPDEIAEKINTLEEIIEIKTIKDLEQRLSQVRKGGGGTSAIGVKQVLNSSVSEFELSLAVKLNNNSYMEYTTDVNDNITQVNYWSNSGKTKKLFTKDITYSGDNPTLVVMKDELDNKTLTTTIAYSGDDISNVTKVLT